MLHKCFLILVLPLVILTLFSCNDTTVYDEVVNIDSGEWEQDQAARFEINIADSIPQYNFYLTVFNTTNYRYSNLFVFLTTIFPDGKKSRDTIECTLADPSGRWLGKGWGNVKESDILLKSNLRFPMTGKYEFFIQQAMREDTLKEVERIGLRLEKSE
jgi:gliding motility-associated lipoprotein GldH